MTVLAWSCGDKLTLQTNLSLAGADFRGFSRKNHLLKVYDFGESEGSFKSLGLNLQAPAFDSRLAKYLLSTVGENNEISTITSLYGQTYLADDETFYGKGSRKLWSPEREKFLEHLARKVAVLVETEPVAMEKLSEHGQLEPSGDI